jgi:hypothetical protein
MKNSFYLFIVVITAMPLNAVRLRFILQNQSMNTLYACLSSHQCDPMIEAEMPPDTNENIYTANLNSKIGKFYFNIVTNNEVTNYTIRYNRGAKMLTLEREGIISDTTPYNPVNRQDPIVILIDQKLDAYFNNQALYYQALKPIDPNDKKYKPSMYLGNNGEIDHRNDQNWFCSRYSPYRKDIASLSSYVGRCNTVSRGDRDHFCRKKKCKSFKKRGHRCTTRCGRRK